MPQTYKASGVTTAIRRLLESSAGTYGLKAIHYGDQEIISKAPAVCVVPAVLRREYNQTGLQTDNRFEINLLVYSSDLRSSVERIQEDCDKLTEDLADLLNIKCSPASRGLGGDQLDGLLMEALTIGIEYAYSPKPDMLMRMNRIILSGRSRTPLLES